jgi:hypothetical protein
LLDLQLADGQLAYPLADLLQAHPASSQALGGPRLRESLSQTRCGSSCGKAKVNLGPARSFAAPSVKRSLRVPTGDAAEPHCNMSEAVTTGLTIVGLALAPIILFGGACTLIDGCRICGDLLRRLRRGTGQLLTR